MTYERIGKWQEAVKANPPHDVDPEIKGSLIKKIRNQAKKDRYAIKEGDECFVCGTDILEVLRKHHLVLVAAYPLRKDINEHIMVLCENHHYLAHCLVYGERGGVTWKTVEKLKEAGYWERFVELDRIAAQALKKIEDRQQMRLAI